MLEKEKTLSPELVLLGLLFSKPRHAYEIHGEFKQELGKVWSVGLGELYAYLNLLAAAAHIDGQMVADLDGIARKVYTITPLGKKRFIEWLEHPCSNKICDRNEFLIRVYFYHRLGLTGLDQLVEQQKTALISRHSALKQRIKQSGDEFERLILEYRQGQIEAILNWLNICCTISTSSTSDRAAASSGG